VVFLADHPRPTRRQSSGGDRHLNFYEPRDNLPPNAQDQQCYRSLRYFHTAEVTGW
jgi:hypothetical protein